jgi:small-conductance mechanosensitive channel
MSIDFTKIFNDFYSEVSLELPKIISGIVVIVVFVILGKLFYASIGKRIQRRWKDSIISNFVSQTAKWAFYIFGVIIALNIIGFGGIASSLIAGAGISAIIFGFAFKDIGENFLAGFILALKRPFEIGDIIEIEGQKGTVKDLDLRITHLRNSEGKDIYIPNSVIIKNSLINYTKDGYLRVSFTIGIAPECSISKTRSLIVNYLAGHKMILKTPEFKVVVQELGQFTTDLQVHFWVDILVNRNLPDDYLGNTIRSEVIADVKELLDINGIEMPSQVIEHKMYRDNKFAIERQDQQRGNLSV